MRIDFRMIRFVKKRLFSIAAFAIVILFWFSDALIHHFVYGEPRFEFIPSDFNELWIRAVIVILVLAFGIYADSFSRKLIIAQKKAEAARIYRSMIFATHHILNNLLNQMQLIRLEALKSRDFDRDIIRLYDNAIDEAVNLIKKLSHLENITEENIRESVTPLNVDHFPPVSRSTVMKKDVAKK